MQLGLNSWPFYTVLLVVCLVLFSYKAKQGKWLCADPTHKSLPHQRTAHRFTTKAPNPLIGSWVRLISYLLPSSWVKQCVFCGKFFSKFLVLGNLTCAQEPRWRRVAWRTRTLYTAISRKVVGKSARDNPERFCGWLSRARLTPRFHPRSRPLLLTARARVHNPGKHMGCFAVYSSTQWFSFHPKDHNRPWAIALMHVYVTQTNFTTKPRFEINSQGCGVKKNTHAQKVQMQIIWCAKQAWRGNLLV